MKNTSERGIVEIVTQSGQDGSYRSGEKAEKLLGHSNYVRGRARGPLQRHQCLPCFSMPALPGNPCHTVSSYPKINLRGQGELVPLGAGVSLWVSPRPWLWVYSPRGKPGYYNTDKLSQTGGYTTPLKLVKRSMSHSNHSFEEG